MNSGCFKKGFTPWNKGLKGYSNGGTFKKGHKLSKKSIIKLRKTRKKQGCPWLIGKPNYNIRGKKNGNWKGKGVGYFALHSWIRRMLGKVVKCDFCGKEKTTPKSIQWANKSHKYKRNLTDWISLCVKCHKKYDIDYRRNLI